MPGQGQETTLCPICSSHQTWEGCHHLGGREPGTEAERQSKQAVGTHSLGDKEAISRWRQKNLRYSFMNLEELKDGRNKVPIFIIP